MASGDKCRMLTYPNGIKAVEHWECDDYRDGFITDFFTGKIISRGGAE